MDLAAAMRTTGAVRAFRPDPVDAATVARILDLARFAPSGGNRQPWRVAVVGDRAVRRRLRDLAVLGWREYAAHLEAGLVPFAPGPDGRPVEGPAPGIDPAGAHRRPTPPPFVDHLEGAPVLLAVAVHLPSLAVLDAGLGRQSIVGGASVYPFVQNLLLAARAEGLGGVLTTFLCRQEPAVRALLALPPDCGLAALVALGVPERAPKLLRRRPVEAFTTIDRFDGPAFPGPSAPV